ncbi:SIR2 family protein [Mucilaginibacter ginsenosidivorax]|uniref:NAD(+) hydrolase ThsA Sir2/TIR-associating SLOG domain-containing protein n=1 Tax=Mucilaginibacter ginsenosidivorax TaxID=862126 RepID=A0A5B8W547_9SPHI|nr:SIR2 family protein [Mucilaginibacter ginsenosidivorax]QEC77468.1 hypothetical protein FSB76_16515 [Mucilaginibacter ginsenosidivorax]
MKFTKQQKDFIDKYAVEVMNGDAAIFAGAGLSAGLGFVNWRELLRDLAEEIDLDIDKEYDLISLAQYHLNKKSRGKINNKIKNEFTTLKEGSKNHKLLARIGIATFWTTNYDKLIENSLVAEKKTVEVKIRNADFASNIKKKDAIVYKMHGDKDSPDEAVLTKDDYETYAENRPFFATALRGDLLSKTFLFIGFSFDDPNLEYILSRIKILLNKNTPTHYCFFKKVHESDFKGNVEEQKEAFLYAKIKQELKIEDLVRYGIHAITVEDYPDIENILLEVERRIKLKNVFISGAAHTYEPYNQDNAIILIHKLSYELAKAGYKIISGFGLGIGSIVINGALDYKLNSNYRNLDDLLILRPFPQVKSGISEINKVWTGYRHEMIDRAGVALFFFGNKLKDDSVALSSGILEEFEICLQHNVIPIPVGCTGSMAKELWTRVAGNPDDYLPDDKELLDLFNKIGDEILDNDALISIVMKILERIRKI